MTNTPVPPNGASGRGGGVAVGDDLDQLDGAAGGRASARRRPCCDLRRRERAAAGAERSGVVPPALTAVDRRVGASRDDRRVTASTAAGSRSNSPRSASAYGVAARLAGELLHPHGRRVQQLLDDAVHGAPTSARTAGRGRGSRRVEPGQLGVDDLVGPGAQRHDGRARRLGALGGQVARRPRRRRSPATCLDVGAARVARPASRPSASRSTSVHAGQLGDAGVDVARQGEVDDDLRPVASAPAARRGQRPRSITWPTAPVQDTTRSASARASPSSGIGAGPRRRPAPRAARRARRCGWRR